MMLLHEQFLAAKLRKKTLAILEDISHYNLMMNTHMLGQSLLKAGYRPDQPRLPAGVHGGGQWTGGAGSSPGISKEPGDYTGIDTPNTGDGIGVMEYDDGDIPDGGGDTMPEEGGGMLPEDGDIYPYPSDDEIIYDSKIINGMEKRGWTTKEVNEAVSYGDRIDAINRINGEPYTPATRYVHPDTGASVVIDNSTNKVIHVGKPNFEYGPESGDAPEAVMRPSPNTRPSAIGGGIGAGNHIGGGGNIGKIPSKPTLGDMEE